MVTIESARARMDTLSDVELENLYVTAAQIVCLSHRSPGTGYVSGYILEMVGTAIAYAESVGKPGLAKNVLAAHTRFEEKERDPAHGIHDYTEQGRMNKVVHACRRAIGAKTTSEVVTLLGALPLRRCRLAAEAKERTKRDIAAWGRRAAKQVSA